MRSSVFVPIVLLSLAFAANSLPGQEVRPSLRPEGTKLSLGLVALGGSSAENGSYSGIDLEWLGLDFEDGATAGVGFRYRSLGKDGYSASAAFIYVDRWNEDLTNTRWDPYWKYTVGIGGIEKGSIANRDSLWTMSGSAGIGVSYWMSDSWAIEANGDITLGFVTAGSDRGYGVAEFALLLGVGYSF